MNRNLFIAIILITLTQVATYFQLQLQNVSIWAKKNPLILSLGGVPVSYALIVYTHYINLAFNGETWPGRLIGFAVGAIVFMILSHFVMNEQINMKTGVCLFLSVVILIIQIFWK